MNLVYNESQIDKRAHINHYRFIISSINGKAEKIEIQFKKELIGKWMIKIIAHTQLATIA